MRSALSKKNGIYRFAKNGVVTYMSAVPSLQVTSSPSAPYPSAALSTAVDASSSSVPSLQAIVTSAVKTSSQVLSTPETQQDNGIDVLVNVLMKASHDPSPLATTRERKKVDVKGTKKNCAKETKKSSNKLDIVVRKGALKNRQYESISRALKSYSEDDIELMTNEEIENAYYEWRKTEAARRKHLRVEKRKAGATDTASTNAGAIVTPSTNADATDTASTNADATDTLSTNTDAIDNNNLLDIDVALATYGLVSHDVGSNGDCQFLAAGHLEVSAGQVRRLVVAELRDLAMKYPLFSDRLRKMLFPSHSDSASS